MRLGLILIAALFLSGCATITLPQMEDRIQEWREGSIDDLIKYWGLPTRQIELGGNHIAEWINQYDDEGNISLNVGGSLWGQNTSINIGTLFNLGGKHEVCQRQVTYTEEGVILKIIWSGDRKYCFELTPDRFLIFN